jgi:hypothetical protein
VQNDDRDVTAAVTALAALTLASCGGGGDGGSAPPPSQNPPPVTPPITITDAEAARFLLQAQFAVTDADLAAVKSGGYAAYLTANYNAPSARPESRGSTRAVTTRSPSNSATSGRSSAIS